MANVGEEDRSRDVTQECKLVLTDREIQVAIETKQIIIEPLPSVEAYSSTSLDLTLSPLLRTWKTPKVAGVDQTTVSPATTGYNYHEFVRDYSDRTEITTDGYVVEPGDFILGFTQELIELPVSSRIAARVEGKSSLARLGIGIHVTAPIIHAGFDGTIQLEICNHGPLRVRLMTGMRVCQLIFEQTFGTPTKGYAGQFLGQTQK